jgi:AcrR family transcriptional regulator
VTRNKSKSVGFSREKWLDMAIDQMSLKCISKFSLDSLIQEMPVSKGSFYSHFKDRSEFLVALAHHWNRRDTDSVIGILTSLSKDTSPQDKLWELMRAIYDMRFNRDELLIRSLTREFPEVAKVVKSVDEKRFLHVRQLFAEMGFKGDELEMRTFAFVSLTSQEGNLLLEQSTESYERQLRLRHEFFIRP